MPSVRRVGRRTLLPSPSLWVAVLAALLLLTAACGGGGGAAPAAGGASGQPAGSSGSSVQGPAGQTGSAVTPAQPTAPAVHILEPFASSTVPQQFTVRLAVDNFKPGAQQDGFIVVQLDGKTVATTDQLQVTVKASPGTHALGAMLVDAQRKPVPGTAAQVNEAITVK
ncbi:MAG: hypothetical protein QJR08_05230 [Bacillota bacterium]|nr:hypothetical protein [Bacillota bacterium]